MSRHANTAADRKLSGESDRVSYLSDWRMADSIGTAVALSVADYHDCSPTNLPLLSTVVDPDALDTALEKDWITRAGLDVTEPEPLPADHELTRHIPEKLVVTPHIASASIQTRDKMATMAAENVLAGLKGEDLPNSAHED